MGEQKDRMLRGEWYLDEPDLVAARKDCLLMDDAAITIGDNAWLGGGVIVCPGVTIGANVVVGAGSVVTRDVPDQVLVAGNPARVLRQI